jgi:hypothetical protein
MIEFLTDLLIAIGWVVAFFAIIVILLGLGLFNDKYHKQIKEEANQLEIERKERREKTGNSITYDELVESLEKKFQMPKDIIYKVEELKDPVVSKKRLNSFIEWIKSKDSDLLAAITSSKSLALVIPGLIIDVTHTTKENGSIRSPELDDNFDAYRIVDWLCYAYEELSNQNIVRLLNYEKIDEFVATAIFDPEDFYDVSWREYVSEMDSVLYTEDEDLEVPEKFDYYFEGNISAGSMSGPIADDSEILYCTISVDYQDKEIVINGSNFKFREDEKERLTTLLMASYKPSLLKRILAELK